MGFKERLKEKRSEAKLTQTELAKKVGVSDRTIQNYELGTRRPQNMEVAQKLAEALNTSVDSLLGTSGILVVQAQEKGGAKAARDIDVMVSVVTAAFAGGRLDDEALDGAMQALTKAYWIAKEKNKKYTPKKYLKDTPADK
ncbi:helix-turn-helix transcriptional regulator [Oscillospiraceae bacterium HV4-5-C5C]|nr:helix-turn-helix transcriptional regulator [Oscillospiraceae bacterium HV4-5-C5C]